MKLFFYIIILGFAVSGCKSKKHDDDTILPSVNLYNDGLDLLDKQKYSKAAEQFGRIFYQNPGDPITPQAELMQAYSLFLDAHYEEAVDILDTFIKLHPANEDIGYAYYLKALSYYMQISGVQLDQSRTSLTKMSFDEVITLFPNTKYALDAALKIDLVNDHLAGKEMYVGRYYLRKNNPIAAINRFELVIDKYQTTSHTPEALYRLIESYMMLGLVEEAKKYAGVLRHNYPDNEWNRYSNSLIGNLKK